MPMWRCPHCGTPQAETARCWVCRRSSTACATCRNFRRSVAAQLGYCGLDRERAPLRGDEIRGCWEAAAAPIEDRSVPAARYAPASPDLDDDRTPVRRLEFVEVKSAPRKKIAVAAGLTPESNLQPPAAKPRRRARPERGANVESAAWPLPSPITSTSAETASEPSRPATRPEQRWSLWGDGEIW
jgi:hypothetical protein